MNLLNYSKIKLILTLALNILIFESNIINPVLSNEIQEDNTKIKEYIKKNSKNDFYILGTGDLLFLTINKETTDINKKFIIDGEGFANLTRLGKIYVKGLTIDELRQLLNEKYSEFLKETNVKLEILKYRPITVFISGEVEEPGIHKLPGAFLIAEQVTNDIRKDTTEEMAQNFDSTYYGTNTENQTINLFDEDDPLYKNKVMDNIYFPTLFDALKKAGGITSKANLNQVKVTRKNSISSGSGRLETTVNLFDVIDFKDTDQNIRILDGDTITIMKSDLPLTEQLSRVLKTNINPKFINVYVGGRIERPGYIKIKKNSTLNDAINISGGTKIIKGPVRIFSYNNEGSQDKKEFRLRKNAKPGSNKNPYLKNGDIIYVGKSGLNIANEVINEITSPLSGIVTSYGLYKALTD